jgi:DNA polymerase/3'-5' exonuclease PolX
LELQGGVKIEVRTSLLKDEGIFSKEKKILNYGWRLKDKNKDIKFDYMVCVALDIERDIENSKCFVLTQQEVAEAPSIEISRFSKVEKRLWIFQDLDVMNEAKKDSPQYIHQWEENINRNKDQYLLETRWKKLSREFS